MPGALGVQAVDHITADAESAGSALGLHAARVPPRWSPKRMLIAADAATISVAMILSFIIRGRLGVDPLAGTRGEHVVIGLVTLPIWLSLFARARLYSARFLGRRLDEMRRITTATMTTLVLTMALSYTAQLPISRAWLAITFAVSVTLMSIEREVARRAFTRLRRSGRLQRGVVIVGSGADARDMAAMLRADATLGYRVEAVVDDSSGAGPIAETLAAVDRSGARSVIIVTATMDVDASNRLVRELVRRRVHVELSSSLRDIAAHRLTVRPLGRVPVVYIEPTYSSGWRVVAKRSFDVLGSLVALLVVAPAALFIGLLIKIDSRGPVIFRQQRVGRNGQLFELQKFRTMVDGAEEMIIDLRDRNEADGPLFKLKSDPRVTRVGSFLRRTSLDELPQLINVLRGEMSLVGPRPALPMETSAWDEELYDRLRVQPGITGMWQVSGRSDSSFEDYTRLDLYYVDNWSLVTDLVILAKTIPVVLLGNGAY